MIGYMLISVGLILALIVWASDAPEPKLDRPSIDPLYRNHANPERDAR
jgi:hypothetical protein